MGDFRKLEIWKESHKLTIEIYKMTKELPNEEKFGLMSQLRRSAVSAESNIAEGEGKFSNNEKVNFFVISRGSISEICTQPLIIIDIFPGLKSKSEDLYSRYDILGRKITNLIKYRRNNNPNNQLTK